MAASIRPPIPATWLKRFCAVSDVYSLIAVPWSITLDGEPWAVSTDRIRIGAVRGEHGVPAYAGRSAPDVARYLTVAPAHTVSLPDLQRWLRSAIVDSTCSTCGGSGQSLAECPLCACEHLCQCACVQRAPRGYIGNVLLNLTWLALAFEGLPDQFIAINQGVTREPFCVWGDGWRYYQMPVWTDHREETWPQFNLGQESR